MRHYVQSGLIASIVVGFAAIAPAQAPKTGQADPRSATKTAVPPRLAMLDQVVATVNGEPIIRDELYRILEATGTPPGASINEDRSIYQMTVDQLVNRLLLKQYLKKQAALAVTEAEIDKEFATFAEQFKKDGQDVNVVLASHGVTVAQVRDEMGTVIRYRKYIEAVANDANLKKFVADNKDVFNRTSSNRPRQPPTRKRRRQSSSRSNRRSNRRKSHSPTQPTRIPRTRATRKALGVVISATSSAKGSSNRSRWPLSRSSRDRSRTWSRHLTGCT
jgi:hypothetical protein